MGWCWKWTYEKSYFLRILFGPLIHFSRGVMFVNEHLPLLAHAGDSQGNYFQPGTLSWDLLPYFQASCRSPYLGTIATFIIEPVKNVTHFLSSPNIFTFWYDLPHKNTLTHSFIPLKIDRIIFPLHRKLWFLGTLTFYLCVLAEHSKCGPQTLAAIPAIHMYRLLSP